MERTVTSLSLQTQQPQGGSYPSVRPLPAEEQRSARRGSKSRPQAAAVPASAPVTHGGETSVTGATTSTGEWQSGLRWMIPLWRHAVWLVALGALLTIWVDIRVDVQQLRKDLDRSGRAFREARVHNDRLRLELDARKRAFALEAAAAQLGLGDNAQLHELTTQANGGDTRSSEAQSASVGGP